MYAYTTLLTNDNISIAIKYIESIHISNNDADVLVDKLRNDIIFGITTISGKYYDISVQHQIKVHGLAYNDIEYVRRDIYKKWSFVTRE